MPSPHNEQAWQLVEQAHAYELHADIFPADLQRFSAQLGRIYELTNEFEKARTVYIE